MIEKLIWDTNFFKLNIGRVLIQDERDFDPEKFNQEVKGNFDLVYVFSYKNMLPVNKTVKANLDLVDIMVTMSMPFTKSNYSNIRFNFKSELTEKEIKECFKIAEETSVVSRFYKEPLIGPVKTKALYRKWIENSLKNGFGDGILLAKSKEIITGIHIIKTNDKEKTGLCSLIGVNSSFKGSGVGRSLWSQAFAYWTSKKNINKCIVPFSLKNTESFNFHLKIGFNKVEEIKYIYHYRNKLI